MAVSEYIIKDEWWKAPPRQLEDQISIFNDRVAFLQDDTSEGKALRVIYKKIKRQAEDLSKKAREQNPIAFAKFGWEQALKCNAWVWGISFKIDFDANRKGKTTCSIFDALLWMLPNDPQWLCFQPYVDDWQREVQLLRRPTMDSVLKLANYLKTHPELKGDPTKQPYDPENAAKFAILQKELPDCFVPSYPSPPFSESEHTIWHGAPDADYHEKIIMKEWNKWLPKAFVVRFSTYDKTIDLDIWYPDGKSHWDIVCKSYEAKDTKWSGAAVTGVLLTEGVKAETLNEIKQRFRNDAFAFWDYTPYEPRNVGKKTALAHRVFKGKERLPLSPFVFSGFGIEKTPEFILPKEKREDLLSMWAGTSEGEARIRGKFYSSSPIVLTNLDLPFHTVPWTRQQLFDRFPQHNLYRGLDPGYDHPTACAWGLLNNVNTWFIYRIYSKAGTSIEERCKDIITLSNNGQQKYKWGKGEDDYYLEEVHTSHDSEECIQTIADYHVFKADETTKQPYANNYTKQGLVLSRSVTTGPRERSQIFDTLLSPDLSKPHPIKQIPPGCKIYFLINEPGVALALEKFENIFWARYTTGDSKGEPKDEIQDHEDDEFDAVSYLVCSPNRFNNIRGIRKEPKDSSLCNIANNSRQQSANRWGSSNFNITG